MNADQPAANPPPSMRPKRRLRLLLAVAALGFGLLLFLQLDRAVVESLGPAAEAFHDAFQRDSGNRPSARALRFVADVKELGGDPRVIVESPGFLGVFGRSEEWEARFRDGSFDDAALARLTRAYGDRAVQLILENTSVSPAGFGQLYLDAKHWSLGVFNDP